MPTNKPLCCGKPMAKTGFGWSGTTQWQRYKCLVCGRALMPTQGEFAVKRIKGERK